MLLGKQTISTVENQASSKASALGISATMGQLLFA